MIVYCKNLFVYRYLIIFVFLLFYMFLTGFTPSILRSGVCFIFNSINKLLKLDVESINVFIFAISIIIFINPFIVYNMGFIFSSVTRNLIIMKTQQSLLRECRSTILSGERHSSAVNVYL